MKISIFTVQNIILCMVLLCMVTPTYAAESCNGNIPVFYSTDTISIRGKNFKVEVAKSAAQLENGLMCRQSMPFDHGMVFDFGTPRPIAMWMKNTLISLDMLFINKNGIITRIAENNAPMSTAVINSEGDVRMVIELGGGICQRYGIKAGDHVKSKVFQ